MSYFRKCIFIIFNVLIFWQSGNTQVKETILTYQEYVLNIYQFHPIAQKAALRSDWAKAQLLESKGALDPKITSNWNEKNFDKKLYYQQFSSKLRIPTMMGVDIVGGYENTDGQYLNPENKTDNWGLWNLGVEIDILQGLLRNQRRTAIEQAKIFQELARNEQQILLNDLMYNASKAYLIWQQYESFNLELIKNIEIADTYFQNTKQAFNNGEKTGLDTLEAHILYKDALFTKQKNELNINKARQLVQNFLWFEGQPVTLLPDTKPENYTNTLFNKSTIFEDNIANNPKIQASLNKISALEVDLKLKREKLKPKLKVKYNPLLQTSSNSLLPNYSVNNFKWQIDFSMPLFLRKERGAIQKGKIKIQEIELDLKNKRNELLNKVQNSWNQQLLLDEQIALLSENVANYKRLLEGENEKFKFGESSVFLLNKRQEKYVLGKLKLIETYIKQQMEYLNYLYYSNQLLD